MAKLKIQMSLDTDTLENLDRIIEQVPEVESRSAATRWAARVGVEKLNSSKPNTRSTDASPRRRSDQ